MTDTLTSIEDLVQWNATARRSLMPNAGFIFDEWLLKHGERFGPSIKRPKGLHLKKKKMCYMNSLQALMYREVDRDEWFYTEGKVWRDGLPIDIDHAWLSNRKGEVIDLTLRDQSPNDQYFGVPFTYNYAAEQTMEHGYYGLFSNGMRYNDKVMESADEGRAWPKGER